MALTLFKRADLNFYIIPGNWLLGVFIRQCHRKTRTLHPTT